MSHYPLVAGMFSELSLGSQVFSFLLLSKELLQVDIV